MCLGFSMSFGLDLRLGFAHNEEGGVDAGD